MIIFFQRLRLRILWSWKGWAAAWREEYSLRSWVWSYLISVVLAFWLPLSAAERALLLALGLLVIAAELFNTAIERTVDRISKEIHPLSGAAKDAASAAVAVTAIAAGIAWVVILIG